jgi:sec-independent protein translocase protein TatA
MNFFDIGFMEILVILFVALLIFGPGKIPGIARSLGKTVNSFKKMSQDVTSQVKKELEAEEKAIKDKSTVITEEKSLKSEEPVKGNSDIKEILDSKKHDR